MTTERVSAVVIGGGHAGLAASHFLSERAIDHVVLERGEVANSWRTERWDSLRLLTPNWQVRLPGQAYDGSDPDGYLSMPELVEFVERYAKQIAAPIRTGVEVTSVRRDGDGYRVESAGDAVQAHAVVIASGACNLASVPAFADSLPSEVVQLP